MNKLRVDELKPGMVFDKAVYIDMNNILVAPMVPLKEEDIKRLLKWGIEEVETAGNLVKQGEKPESNKVSLKDKVDKLTKMMVDEGKGGDTVVQKNLREMYDDLVILVEDIFEKVRNGAGYDKKVISDSIDALIENIKQDRNKTIEVSMGENEGAYIYTLAVSVAYIAIVTGISLGYGDHRLEILGIGALLHDIGMVRVPNYITEKKGSLTPDEYNRVKTHPIYGYRIITKELALSSEIATIALQHHEAFDGSGYPRKTKGNNISEYARIVSICDVFVAMTKERSYRQSHLSYNAMKSILSESNRKYDPYIVKIFLSNMAIYPVGSIVQLNNNVIGRVISANPELPLRPRISVLIDEFGKKISGEDVVDLQVNTSIFIKKPLSREYLRQILHE